MQELLYLLKVGSDEGLHRDLAACLAMPEAPNYLRLATLAPLSNYGYASYEGTLIAMHEGGLVVGSEETLAVPRLFVPWQNVSYIADGTSMREQVDPRLLVTENA